LQKAKSNDIESLEGWFKQCKPIVDMLILRKIKTAYMTLKIQLKARILCKFGGNIEMKKGK
jgi:hypothetical protein